MNETENGARRAPDGILVASVSMHAGRAPLEIRLNAHNGARWVSICVTRRGGKTSWTNLHESELAAVEDGIRRAREILAKEAMGGTGDGGS